MKKHILYLNIAGDRIRKISPVDYIPELSANATPEESRTYFAMLKDAIEKNISWLRVKDGHGLTIEDYLAEAEKYLAFAR